jgi:UPF0755 protein
MFKKIFFTLVVLGIFFIGGVSYYTYSALHKTYTGPDKTFVVKTGDTFGKVNQRLLDEGIITDARMFHYYAKYKDYLTRLRAGAFTIPRGSNMIQVLDTLIFGQPNLTRVTIPEGKNMYEIAKIFDSSGVTTEEAFLKAVQEPDLITNLQVPGHTLEGYLYPETYRFAPNTPAESVVRAMVDLFNEKTKEIDFTHPFLNKHQVVILASVVEKETGAKFERPAIAGVFTNRLIKRMRLQSDPTTIYGIWERYTGNIKRSDLLEMTPYNTYKIPALPKGPISNPSLEAIHAVLNPEQHNYYFFVSRNDGTHVFTTTYKEHSKAVEDFQINAKARKGKSWRDLKQ